MWSGRFDPSKVARDVSGTAVVEFSLVTPMLLTLLFGMIAFGSFLGFAHSLQTIASESARAAVAGLDPAERVILATTAAQRNLSSNPLLKSSAVTIDAGEDASDPDRFTVTLRYDLSATVLNVLPRLLPLPRALSRTASIRRGGL